MYISGRSSRPSSSLATCALPPAARSRCTSVAGLLAAPRPWQPAPFLPVTLLTMVTAAVLVLPFSTCPHQPATCLSATPPRQPFSGALGKLGVLTETVAATAPMSIAKHSLTNMDARHGQRHQTEQFICVHMVLQLHTYRYRGFGIGCLLGCFGPTSDLR